MALFNVGFTVVDAKNKRRRVNLFVPRSTHTLANMQVFVNAMAVSLDEITECAIEAASMTIGMTLPGGLKANAIADSDVEEGANLQFSQQNSEFLHGIHIPGLLQGLFIGEDLDAVAPSVLFDFNALIVAGVNDAGALMLPSGRYENDLTAYVGGKKSFRRK